jgi:uncharacterized membrane protein
MIETIIPSLVVAAASGLAFLSYKHHDGYDVLAKILKLVVLFVIAAASAYSFGFTEGKYSTSGEMPFSLGWLLIGALLFLLFLLLLDLLPLLTKNAKLDDNR